MYHRNSYRGMDPFAVRLICKKARQLIGRAGLSEEDIQDLEQDLMLDLLIRLEKYDSDRSRRNFFIARIIKCRIATLLEHRRSLRRNSALAVSLNDLITLQDGELAELCDLLSNDGFLKSPARETSETKKNDLSIDLQLVMEALPPDLQDICSRLFDKNTSQIAREKRVSREKLYEKLDQIKEAFLKAGLEKYL